jgi:hypothetical protein
MSCGGPRSSPRQRAASTTKAPNSPIPAHTTVQAPTGLLVETVLADTRRHSVSALTRKWSSISSGANAGARTCNLLGTPPNALGLAREPYAEEAR